MPKPKPEDTLGTADAKATVFANVKLGRTGIYSSEQTFQPAEVHSSEPCLNLDSDLEQHSQQHSLDESLQNIKERNVMAEPVVQVASTISSKLEVPWLS